MTEVQRREAAYVALEDALQRCADAGVTHEDIAEYVSERRALVRVAPGQMDEAPGQIARYLPTLYRVVGPREGGVLIAGRDFAGWTLEDYVIPRLASGLWFAEEVA